MKKPNSIRKQIRQLEKNIDALINDTELKIVILSSIQSTAASDGDSRSIDIAAIAKRRIIRRMQVTK